ncbi:hypothetical protein FisN_10Hh242 [Fistulifera solaris]|uniref:Uncharacterized protein n=1 Tax=Fistulifera solaris TaxID=1519565 RepID=A0A1Z5JWY6_FISSO|nr:hypothetical protein FisN_10Hh242 [Fistulifera solaris]|eukprot:GAX18557.1 hypothetical protein FisN_10Hh242 [Fistulifera solaris]
MHEIDTEEVAASFLLSLKHSRSVTPEPNGYESDYFPRKASYQSYSKSFEEQDSEQSYKGLFPDTQLSPKMPPATELLDLSDLPPLESLIEGSKLVLMKDIDLVPDALFVAMAQMKPCRLTPADRVGCYKTREIGFLGMCCKHCEGQPGFGRYYPNSVRSLAQTTTSQTILKHIAGKCRFCPPSIRDAVIKLQQLPGPSETTSSGRPRYGSRKIFFQRVWSRLHEGAEHESDDLSTETPDMEEASMTSEGDHSALVKRKNDFGKSSMSSSSKRIKTTLRFD